MLLSFWAGAEAFWRTGSARAGNIALVMCAESRQDVAEELDRRSVELRCRPRSPHGHPWGADHLQQGTVTSLLVLPRLAVGRGGCRPRQGQSSAAKGDGRRKNLGCPSPVPAGSVRNPCSCSSSPVMQVPAQQPRRGEMQSSSHRPRTRGGVSYSNKNAPFHLGDCSQLEMKTFVPEIGVIPGIATPRLCFQLIC